MTITTFDQEIAYLDWHLIKDFQYQQFKSQLQYTLKHNPSYAKLLQDKGINLNAIKSLDDLVLLPILNKSLVQENIADYTCIQTPKIAEIDTTSGTLGSPLSIALSQQDLERLAYNETLSFLSMGVTRSDIVQLTLTLDRQFMAGMAYYSGLRKIGATIIRIGPGVPQMQWDSIYRYSTTVLVGVPSFILKLVEFAINHNIDYKHCTVTKILAIGESIYDETGAPTILYQKLHDLWPIEYFNTYASTEMQTGFTECEAHNGMHLNPDLIIAEVIDEKGNPVAEHEVGELCITTLGIEGVPLIRYQTGDITSMDFAPCTCGKKSPRIKGIIGRKQHLLKIKGTSIYPNAIFEALNQLDFIQAYVVEAYLNEVAQDDCIIHINLHEDFDFLSLKKNIEQHLKGKLKINLKIQECSKEKILKMQFPIHSRKQIKFIDNR